MARYVTHDYVKVTLSGRESMALTPSNGQPNSPRIGLATYCGLAEREQQATMLDQQPYLHYIAHHQGAWLACLLPTHGAFSLFHPEGHWHQQKARFVTV